MPWREASDPYRTWLSETMAQQTQIATVIPYFNRFVERFPTVHDLADAKLDDVLALWAGLGYYARARNLHRAARMVVDELNGQFPQTAEELEKLPGIGAYTAGAIASIAFGERAAVVDGNVARVLSRLFLVRDDIQSVRGKERLWHLARELVPPGRPGDFNQALMELGATVCTPGETAGCLVCPLRANCAAREGGVVAGLPVKVKKGTARPECHVVAAMADRRGRWLFVRRPANGLWGGLWELPTTIAASRADRHDTAGAAARLADCVGGVDFDVEAAPFCNVTHQLSHRTVTFVGHVCRAAGSPMKAKSAEARWLRLAEVSELGISTAMKKVVGTLRARDELSINM